MAAANIKPVRVVGDVQCMVSSIASDSREVTAGGLFVAIPGVQNDGTKYIESACQRGAVVVVTQQGSVSEWTHNAVLVEVIDVRAAIAAFAAAFYPPQSKFCFAITGTDGKTSTAEFVRQLAQLSGMNAASIGTLGLRSEHPILNREFPANNTSPEPILLHKTLSVLADAGVDVVAIETSSHGLDQKRADGVRFAAGAFTNLTRDHLDYHGSIEKYFAAKARLFSEVLSEGSLAVLNHDDTHFSALKSICESRSIRVISFGTHADATYRIASVTPHANGLDAQLILPSANPKQSVKNVSVSLPLYGAFQLSNMLAAMGLLHAADFSAENLVAFLPKLTGVPGRLEKVATHASGASIFVDYAHTPAALENILKTLRHHTAKKLHIVFGCGGDRDAGKRPEMGHAATQYADVVTVTDDNPRSENPAVIRAAIMASAPGAHNIAGRDKAIQFAVQQLSAGDVLVVAGKGHEQTQMIGNETIHFSDAEQIQHAVRA
jgi:UDP-N-acetylmuramoyl-L-alanyl-D-glutamate--2,6-diaminopimelate ligase